jgi:hypothetical protein
MSTGPTRRAVLAAGLVGAGLVGLTGLAGCTDDAPPTSGPSTAPDHDATVTATVVADKRETLRVYDAVIAAHAAVLTAPLAPYVTDHVAHLSALGATPPATPAPSPTPAPSASPTPTSIAVPDRPDDALALLVARELAASQRRVEQVATVSAELARLLGSIGAAEAVHAALLPDVLDRSAA